MTRVDPAAVRTLESLRTLPAQELLTMWRGLEPPGFGEMDGEFDGAFLPPVAAQHAGLRKINGPGEWIAKAFAPRVHGPYPGQGYNVWFTPRGVSRQIRFATEIGDSPIDGRPALLLHYSAFRHHTSKTGMLNEVRKVEAGLYLAVTTATVETPPFGPIDGASGRSKPAPFLLRGPVSAWIGVDDETAELDEAAAEAATA